MKIQLIFHRANTFFKEVNEALNKGFPAEADFVMGPSNEVIVWHPNPQTIKKDINGQHILQPSIEDLQGSNFCTANDWIANFKKHKGKVVFLDLKRDEGKEGSPLTDVERAAFRQLALSFQGSGVEAHYSSFCPEILKAIQNIIPSQRWLLIRPELNRGYFSRYPSAIERGNDINAIADFSDPRLIEEVIRLVDEGKLSGLSLFHNLTGLTSLMKAIHETKPELQFAFWTVNDSTSLNTLLGKVSPLGLETISIISNDPVGLSEHLPQ